MMLDLSRRFGIVQTGWYIYGWLECQLQGNSCEIDLYHPRHPSCGKEWEQELEAKNIFKLPTVCESKVRNCLCPEPKSRYSSASRDSVLSFTKWAKKKVGTKSHSVSEDRSALGSSIDNGVCGDRNSGCGCGHGGQSRGAPFNNENELYCTHCCKDPHPIMTCFN